MSEKIPYDLLARYFSENCQDEDKMKVNDWILQSEENRQIFEEYSKIWNNSGLPVTNKTFNVDDDLAKVHQVIDDNKKYPAEGNNLKFLQILTRIAAILIIAVGLFFLIKNIFTHEKYIIKQTARIEKTKIELPDGSSVWLNSESLIKYPEKFGLNERKIYLEGEAFFDVLYDEKKSFIIETPTSKIKVLGTSFNVRAREKEKTVTITVETGTVGVSDKNEQAETISVTKGEMAVLDKKTKEVTIHKNDNINYNSWQTGKLVFTNTPFSEVVLTLSDYFNSDFIIEDEKIKDQIFNGSFENYDLKKVLNIIELTSNIKSKEENGNIYLFLTEVE